MRQFGHLLLAGGLIGLVYALNLETSVEVTTGMFGTQQIQNIGLMADRQNLLIVAALVTLTGVLISVFGSSHENRLIGSAELIKKAKSPPPDRDLANDAYRLWLAEKYAIQRNELFDRFVLRDQMYSSLDTALAAAHNLDCEESFFSETQSIIDDEVRNYHIDQYEANLRIRSRLMKKLRPVVFFVIVGIAPILYFVIVSM